MAWACTSSPKGTRNISSPTIAGSSGEVAPEVTNGMPADWNRGAIASAKVVSLWPMPAARLSIATARLAAVAASLVSFLVSMALISIIRPPSRPPPSLIILAFSFTPFSDGPSSDARPPLETL